MRKLVTIGIYGFTAQTFFQALRQAHVDLFCDIRQRRGVRGAAYAFANSQRLQASLEALGIGYLHSKELAPTSAMRQRQNQRDKVAGIAKRQRDSLSPAFMEAYRQEILASFDAMAWWEALPDDARVIALCCVEREPAACHRSRVAEALQQLLSLEVEHLTP